MKSRDGEIRFSNYDNLGCALGVIAVDQEYVLLRHTLAATEKIPPHLHPEANEWLLAGSIVGSRKKISFIITLGQETQRFDISGGAILITLPKNTLHSVEALTDMTYFVIRDKKDVTVNEPKA